MRLLDDACAARSSDLGAAVTRPVVDYEDLPRDTGAVDRRECLGDASADSLRFVQARDDYGDFERPLHMRQFPSNSLRGFRPAGASAEEDFGGLV